MTLGTCYSVWMTVWYAGCTLCDTWYLLFCMDDCLVCRVHPAYQTVIHTE